MQQDWIGYVILFFAFCVAPLFAIAVIGGTIWWLRRSAKKTQPSPIQTGKASGQPMKTNQPQPAKKSVTATAPPTQAHQTPPAAAPASKAATAPRALAPKKSAGPFTPIYLNFSNKPNAILESMETLTAQAAKVSAARTRWSKGPRALFWLGLALVGVEVLFWLLGYEPTCIFLAGGIGLWVVGIFLGAGLRRAQVQEFPPRFDAFAQVVHTLRDDVRPGAGIIGNLDLTGARQSSKVARSANDTRGRTTQYFRDQWLNFKAKMYDGNILRVSGIQRIKERNGYYGVGKISGKSKWKPAKLKGSYQELKVRIAVNNEAYKIVRNHDIKEARQVGEYTINAVDTEGGIVTVLASSGAEEISAQSVLGVLKFAYGLLEMKKA
jgi:hypothetical protein